MSQIVCYQHFINNTVVLIPVPMMGQDERTYNQATYGSEYGEHRQPYLLQGDNTVYIDVTTQTIVVADDHVKELRG